MDHVRGTLSWHDANKTQVRQILMRNGVAGTLWTVAFGLFMAETWAYGPSLYLIDTLTDKGARVTIQGPEEFDVKVSSRTGEALLADLSEQFPALLDKIVVMD
jgi:hypothetical protein